GEIVGLAGGSGITPFRSMIRDIVEGNLDVKLTLLYGIRCPDDIIFGDELQALAEQAPGKITIHFVCSEPDSCWEGPSGFLSAACIAELAGDLSDKTLFVCGPPQMYRYLDEELKTFSLPPKRIRKEASGEVKEIDTYPAFPQEVVGKSFRVSVTMGNKALEIPALATETVLVALERANLAPPSKCRSGECGFCRSRLVSGEVYVRPEDDGRRSADKVFGFIHPCASYPVSDLVLEVPRDVV
ncbi:MAG TPA: 2Fe-2S iron-sulfur cluster binding domain-containing protein, partial [Deltaproteobacteria bacterium]|nr:2Fe-2S iron-sulfur cluster binding domain-containing protein [Deltaproteobacteria bacterium]